MWVFVQQCFNMNSTSLINKDFNIMVLRIQPKGELISANLPDKSKTARRSEGQAQVDKVTNFLVRENQQNRSELGYQQAQGKKCHLLNK